MNQHLDIKKINAERYLQALESVDSRVHARLTDIHKGLCVLTAEMLAIILNSNDQDETERQLIFTLEFVTEKLAKNFEEKKSKIPLSHAEKIGLTLPKRSANTENSALAGLIEELSRTKF